MIIYCKECKYNEESSCVHPDNTPRLDFGDTVCEYYLEVPDDHYCSYGKRKDND